MIIFMKSFKYPLAGEFSFRRNLLTELRTLIGVLRLACCLKCKEIQPNRICQVDLANSYDHKHQKLSINDETTGYQKCQLI